MAVFPRRRVCLNLLRISWVFIIIWFEYGTFTASVRSCKWPDETLHTVRLFFRLPLSNLIQPKSGHDVKSVHAKPSHVLLVADPQIVDRRSYPSRGLLSTYLTRLIVDLNLRKNWRVAINKQPDAVVFLGDMMDNGRGVMSDQEYVL
jgi:ethanolamine phosphate phosphodiesterase